MTAEDINGFLAHSDGESSDSSDWNDVKEEAEEEEEIGSCEISAALRTVSALPPIPQTSRGSLDTQVDCGLLSYCRYLFHMRNTLELHLLLVEAER